jgi:hypothetical protein
MSDPKDIALITLAVMASGETVKAIVQGVVSPTAKVLGESLASGVRNLTGSVTKAILSFPERCEQYLQEVCEAVPEERRVPAAPEIVGPVFERLRFIDDSNKLKDLYLNLLKAAIDSKSTDLVHPRFIRALEQMAPEDAILFEAIRRHSLAGPVVIVNLPPESGKPIIIYALNQPEDQIPELSRVPHGKLRMSIGTLTTLGLIRVLTQREIAGIEVRWDCEVTHFGRLFSLVCLPEVGKSS